MIWVAWEGTDGLAWLESDSRFHGPVGSGRVGVGRRSEGASAKAMPATALNAPWRSASLATVSTSGERLPSLVLEVVLACPSLCSCPSLLGVLAHDNLFIIT